MNAVSPPQVSMSEYIFLAAVRYSQGTFAHRRIVLVVGSTVAGLVDQRHFF